MGCERTAALAGPARVSVPVPVSVLMEPGQLWPRPVSGVDETDASSCTTLSPNHLNDTSTTVLGLGVPDADPDASNLTIFTRPLDESRVKADSEPPLLQRPSTDSKEVPEEGGTGSRTLGGYTFKGQRYESMDDVRAAIDAQNAEHAASAQHVTATKMQQVQATWSSAEFKADSNLSTAAPSKVPTPATSTSGFMYKGRHYDTMEDVERAIASANSTAVTATSQAAPAAEVKSAAVTRFVDQAQTGSMESDEDVTAASDSPQAAKAPRSAGEDLTVPEVAAPTGAKATAGFVYKGVRYETMAEVEQAIAASNAENARLTQQALNAAKTQADKKAEELSAKAAEAATVAAHDATNSWEDANGGTEAAKQRFQAMKDKYEVLKQRVQRGSAASEASTSRRDSAASAEEASEKRQSKKSRPASETERDEDAAEKANTTSGAEGKPGSQCSDDSGDNSAEAREATPGAGPAAASTGGEETGREHGDAAEKEEPRADRRRESYEEDEAAPPKAEEGGSALVSRWIPRPGGIWRKLHGS